MKVSVNDFIIKAAAIALQVSWAVDVFLLLLCQMFLPVLIRTATAKHPIWHQHYSFFKKKKKTTCLLYLRYYVMFQNY